MRTLLAAILGLALLSGALVSAALGAPAPPNVLVLVSDDHRADVLGCAGHPIVKTPHLDRLAAEGARFENAFVTTSVCAASRASLLTGLVERTHGYTFGTPPLARQMCDQSYPFLLRAAGYRTGFVGKIGIRVEGDRATLDSMFDVFAPFTRTPYRKTLPDGTTRHVTDLCGDRALDFLKTNPEGTPFCLTVGFNAAHAEDADKDDHFPYPDAEAKLYEGVAMPRPELDDPAIFDALPDYLKSSLNRERWFWRWDTPEKYDRNLRNYFRMLSGLDRNIGRILAELEAQGLTDNTVVLFTGDNGYYMGERGFAGKWSHFEESLRVPLIVRDPRAKKTAIGRVASDIALNIDIAATILDAAGVPAAVHAQGRSLRPLATDRGRKPEPRTELFCEHLFEHESIPRWQGIRGSRYKYARYLDAPAEDAEWLHDLDTDPTELRNLATSDEHAEVLASMRARCDEQARSYAAASKPILEPRPRVLLLGDSISMGYHRHVQEALANRATVVRPRENCAGTTNGIKKIDRWLLIHGGRFDVIHFNFGLHDLKRVKSDGRNSNDPNDRRQADVVAYERNLREIVDKLRATGAELLFATTTPVPEGVRPHRDVEDPARYNEVASQVMAEHRIAIDDLYAFAMARIDEIQRPKDVHFSPEGSQVLATEVVRHVDLALARRKSQ